MCIKTKGIIKTEEREKEGLGQEVVVVREAVLNKVVFEQTCNNIGLSNVNLSWTGSEAGMYFVYLRRAAELSR
jgi:hypothetical protein